MDSGSITIMIKALLLSVFLHLILLLILGKLSFSVPPLPDFPTIRISFKASPAVPAPAAGPADEVPVERDVSPVSEEPEALPVAAEMPEPETAEAADTSDDPVSVRPVAAEPVAVRDEPPVVISDKGPPIETSRVPSEGEGSPAASEPAPSVESATASGPGVPSAAAAGDAGEDRLSGNSDLPQMSWEGSALFPRSIPEPEFSIPYNASLPEYINVRFEVSPDGTVFSCSVLPPGSGHIDLDRQIRAYVADFLFEEFDFSESHRRGTLKLSLRAMGNGI